MNSRPRQRMIVGAAQVALAGMIAFEDPDQAQALIWTITAACLGLCGAFNLGQGYRARKRTTSSVEPVCKTRTSDDSGSDPVASGRADASMSS